MVGMLRRRRWLRRSLSFASVAIMLVAVGMIGYPFYTNLYADRLQSQLDRQLSSDELRQDYEDRNVQEGDSLTRIQIPAIDVDVVVVEGVSPSALRAGAGHYPSTPLPCEDGNVAIAGHRTTYGRPFHNLDLLQPGDKIILTTPIGACEYHVTEQTIVRPSDVSVVQNQGDNRLTLTTCHPKGSARQRLVISAALVGPTTPPA
jgi:sortase A